MTDISQRFVLVKKISPVGALPGCGLLIIASGKFSHAITAVGALIWVYGLTTLVIYAAAKIFPRQGRVTLISFLASFMSAVYLLTLWFLSPLCAMESFFAVSLVPVFYTASGAPKRFNAISAEDSFFSSFFEALSLGVLLLVFALIREPISYMSLSLPGGAQGSVILFSFNAGSFLPVHLVASSCGTLLLLGYFWALYRYVNKAKEGDKDAR
jgi:hypothetical protein